MLLSCGRLAAGASWRSIGMEDLIDVMSPVGHGRGARRSCVAGGLQLEPLVVEASVLFLKLFDFLFVRVAFERGNQARLGVGKQPLDVLQANPARGIAEGLAPLFAAVERGADFVETGLDGLPQGRVELFERRVRGVAFEKESKRKVRELAFGGGLGLVLQGGVKGDEGREELLVRRGRP